MVRRLASPYSRNGSLDGEEWLGGLLSLAGHLAILLALTAIASQRTPTIPRSPEIFGVFVPVGGPDGVSAPIAQAAAGGPADVVRPLPPLTPDVDSEAAGVSARKSQTTVSGPSTVSSVMAAEAAGPGLSLGVPTGVTSCCVARPLAQLVAFRMARRG